MTFKSYPEEVQKWIDTYKPYRIEILEGRTENVPQEALDAYKKAKEWAWSW